MAASYTDITVDQTNWTTDEKTKAKKALAHYFNKINEDGSLDTSEGAELNILFQKKVAKILKVWYKNAKEYEDNLVSDEFDIETE